MMNKKELSCKVIQDMLMLYEIDSCSEDTRQIIDEHLETCSQCRAFYQRLSEDAPQITLPKEYSDEVKADEFFYTILKKIQTLFQRRMILCGLILLGILVVFGVGRPFWSQFSYISSQDITVKELYQLENGALYCTLSSSRRITSNIPEGLSVPETEKFKSTDQGWQDITFVSSFKDRLFIPPRTPVIKEMSFIIPLSLTTSFNSEDITQECSTIYYKGKFNDRLVIWEKGQDIEPAPASIEAYVQERLLFSYAGAPIALNNGYY